MEGPERWGRAARWSPSRGWSLLLILTLAACDLPRDPSDTLERVRGGTLRVGAVAAPPWLVPDAGGDGDAGDAGGAGGAGPSGPEAELVRAFAESVDAEVEWRWASLDEHMRSLEAFELDLVAAGLTTDSPWKAKVGFSRPWRTDGRVEHVLAVPPGENGLLVALERVIETGRVEGR